MAMSALSFLQPIPRLDPLCTSLTTDACSACSPISSLSGPSHSLWISSERSRVVVKAAKGRREKMDFFLDDVGESEDTIPDDVVDMEEWMRNRPAGFGIGKVYDLSLEEKLLAEVEADRKAREAAKARKGLGQASQPKKKQKASKVTEAPAGVEVWVGNLPRKRKVDRDLRAAFRNAPGLLHIRPVVEPENEKTRDPMCRGFAFFTFATEDDAYDFASMYDGVKVKFGRVEKKVACEVAKSNSPFHPKPNRTSSSISAPKLQVRDINSTNESRLPSTPIRLSENEFNGNAVKNAKPMLFEVEGQEEDDDDDTSETELRALEEEIWDQFEDEDDMALDMEFSVEEGIAEEDNDEIEPSYSRSSVDEHALSESVESPRDTTLNRREGSNLRASVKKAVQLSYEEDEDEDEDDDDFSAEKIRELEAKVREMEMKLALSTQDEEERIELLEKRLLSKAKSAVGVSAARGEGERKKAGAKQSSKAGKKTKTKSKSDKPKIGSLGSASRLKAKERAILTGVLTKYVSNSP
ncbi:uncharacterized protein [Physcomitrium patens]|uniref:RRM domain-containing protein n=1 Tax=Physcomitrium patens TaxID=3218 RepID=A0A2K1LBV4_PHYPA|nr:uncharacterized protein LOC112282623 [Physcomitrium patens]PNR63503.1 hypothetical protein PHYPA_001929 [Physcomitrium patens]|eukprot:XP_024376261.1 uncharacterized protein LOC112282623 [Physcomitrella patens]